MVKKKAPRFFLHPMSGVFYRVLCCLEGRKQKAENEQRNIRILGLVLNIGPDRKNH